MVKYLLEICSLTYIQVDTLLCDLEGKKKNYSVIDSIVMRDGKLVKPGAFLRTKIQAQKNIRQSFATLVLLTYLGILPVNSVLSLTKIVELMNELQADLSHSKKAEIFDILKRIINEVSKT